MTTACRQGKVDQVYITNKCGSTNLTNKFIYSFLFVIVITLFFSTGWAWLNTG